jgi:hypothetical protein
MDNTSLYTSLTGQLFFLGEYSSDYVIEDFNKVRDIILNLNTQDEFLEYIVTVD